MSDTPHGRIHDLDVTVWVGKAGVDSVVEETADQLSNRDLVKVKFLQSAQGDADVESLADKLASATDATVVDTRGNTAVLG